MMWLVLVVIVIVFMLYLIIYLGSIIDFYGNFDQFLVGIVNFDWGIIECGKDYDFGKEMVKKLFDDFKFNYVCYVSEVEVQEVVCWGDIYFNLMILCDFSCWVLSGDSVQYGLFKFYVFEGSSYFVICVVLSFVDILLSELNKLFGENCWEVVQDLFVDV